MKKFLLLTLIACISTPAFCGEITEIELTDLTGTYIWLDSKSTTFQFDRIPQNIYGMQVRIVGVLSPGTQYCECGGLGMHCTIGMRFVAEIPDTNPDVRWIAIDQIRPESFNWDDVEFELTIEFEPRNGVAWDILEDGIGQVNLLSREQFSNCPCDLVYPYFPSSIITSVKLIVDADIIVGTEESSWGAIKSLMK